MKQLQRITEAEVIAEFLKNEFYQEEFHRDRHQFEHLVMDADLTNEEENALRRALLYRRRGHMWRELPADTQWWQVELEVCDLPKLRVFPRAHWRKIADGSFGLTDIVEQIRQRRFAGKIGDFISKIQSLAYDMRHDGHHGAVILIGVDSESQLTILEGNHRITAAMLGAPNCLNLRFRVLLGTSPRMDDVCWHKGNLANIARYVKNRLKHLWYDEEADVAKVLTTEADLAAHSYSKSLATANKIMPESK